MKKIRIFTVCMLGLFSLLISNRASAQTVPTCESMGYTMTESTCNSKSKAILRCPLDSSKVFCGLTACDMVTEKTCSTNYTCNGYHPTCPSKCSSCICNQTQPANWRTALESSSNCKGKYGFKPVSWCTETRYICCKEGDRGCITDRYEP